jgi:hypothetical protein
MIPVTVTQIQMGIALVERIWGSPIAHALMEQVKTKLMGDLTPEDRASLEANLAAGLAARADAFERANRP